MVSLECSLKLHLGPWGSRCCWLSGNMDVQYHLRPCSPSCEKVGGWQMDPLSQERRYVPVTLLRFESLTQHV